MEEVEKYSNILLMRLPHLTEKHMADLIVYHKRRYYAGNPLVSDYAFDALEARLKEVNPDHPVLQTVGAPQ